MPTHLSFSFGVGEYFRFGFEFGRRRDLYAEGVDNRYRILDSELAKRNGVKIDPPEKPVIPKTQPGCLLFTAIPNEIREMIYYQLLTAPEIIEKAHKHLGSKDTAMVDNYRPIPDVDATVLRTCRLIYSEALPILYGQNTFAFYSVNAIRSFQSKSLCLGACESGQRVFVSTAANTSEAFNFKLAPMGRLTMIRSIVLSLNAEYRWANTTIGANGQRGPPNRDHIWRDWSTTLFSESDDMCPWSSKNGLSFPVLEKLTLDFTEWQLAETEGLLVKPFVKKLGESGGLQELVLKGVKHVPTQEKFRIGLVKDGGSFRVVN
ncbi:hypothetical protein ACLMJK_003594 [Lecanora helva]